MRQQCKDTITLSDFANATAELYRSLHNATASTLGARQNTKACSCVRRVSCRRVPSFPVLLLYFGRCTICLVGSELVMTDGFSTGLEIVFCSRDLEKLCVDQFVKMTLSISNSFLFGELGTDMKRRWWGLTQLLCAMMGSSASSK